MQECHPNPLSASDLKKGLKCAALFHEPVADTVTVGSSRPETVPRWFRVRVESVIRGSGPEGPQAAVYYMDYGNRLVFV